MNSVYDRVWTIRGLVDVSDDVFLLPGDQLRIVGKDNGPYAVIVLRGNTIWEQCADLVPAGGEDPTINIPQAGDSVSMCDGGAYHGKVRTFVDSLDEQFKRLEGTLPTSINGVNSVADVKIWAPRLTGLSQRTLIIQAKHRSGEQLQNGTAHGDHT